MALKEEVKIQNKPVNRYVLQKYTGRNSRHNCPNCGQKLSYTKFIDVTTGYYVGDEFGRCDRVEKCGYFNAPSGDKIGKNTIMISPKLALPDYQEEESGISIIENARVLSSLTLTDNFSKFLFQNFESVKVRDALLRYKVGESDRWPGSTVFWQIDQDYDTRTGKIILYDPETGKRVKKPHNKISWQHIPDRVLLDKQYVDFKLKQCIFGEHTLTPETTEVHIVESEKTAIMCHIMDGKCWIALGGIEMVNEERLLPFKHCKLTFYPDKGEKAMTKWKNKLLIFSETFDMKVNTSLEKSNLEDGSDLGDLLLSKIKK